VGSEEHEKRWPVIGQSDVVGFCREICESIIELENALEAGDLSSRLNAGHFETVLGPSLYETYERLGNTVPGPLQKLRVEAVYALLSQLDDELVPIQVARAQVHVSSEGDSCPAAPGTDSRRRTRFKLASASFDGASSTTLRFDQMLAARFWGIGFTFETLDLCDAFAQEVVRKATTRLANDLLGVQRILERLADRTLTREVKLTGHPRAKRFEHLVLDILNEDDLHARVAPLLEDFFEKTDLRVSYPELKRRRGARVQVTSIVEPEGHESKLQAIRMAEEFVFLSPLSLADFVDSLQTPAGSPSGRPSCALGPLWDCLEVHPTDVPTLASELKRIMFRALQDTPDSPLGPMVRVPQPVRQLIRLFVETRAIASTSRLREREKVV
jgi:hypothetical protein